MVMGEEERWAPGQQCQGHPCLSKVTQEMAARSPGKRESEMGGLRRGSGQRGCWIKCVFCAAMPQALEGGGEGREGRHSPLCICFSHSQGIGGTESCRLTNPLRACC